MFSKLDETDAFGALYELSHQSGIPLSYWSAGQRVPEDLEVASAQRLAELLLGRRYTVPFRSSLDAPVSAARSSSLNPYAVTMNTVTR